MDEDIFLTLERDFKETLDSIEAEDLWGIRIIFESDDEDDHQPQSLSVQAYLHLETTSQQPGLKHSHSHEEHSVQSIHIHD